jgi:hypothetical protein
VATQLEQLITYLDRPGVTLLEFAVGKPITMGSAKGVLNVTGRVLSYDQLVSLVRGTPLEALLADKDSGAGPLELELGGRIVSVTIVRGAAPILSLHNVAATEPVREKTGTKPPSSTLKAPAAPAPRARTPSLGPTAGAYSRARPVSIAPGDAASFAREEVSSRGVPLAQPGAPNPAISARARQASMAPATASISPETRILPEPPRISPAAQEPMPAPRAAPDEPRAPGDMRSRPPSIAPPLALLSLDDDALELPPPLPSHRSALDHADDLELPPPRSRVPSVGPPRLEVDFNDLGPSQAFDAPPPAVPAPASRPSAGKLMINVSSLADPPMVTASPGGDLGLPPDLASRIARPTGLVLITAARGHGKTRTLAALFAGIDRSAVPNVVTVDELRDRESFDLALTMAESGYFVLATLTAATPAAALETVLDAYPGMAHSRVRTRLISTLGAVIAKRLPPTPTEIVSGAALRTLLGG